LCFGVALSETIELSSGARGAQIRVTARRGSLAHLETPVLRRRDDFKLGAKSPAKAASVEQREFAAHVQHGE
ncbi:MAG TPA: hypothetical protein VEQ58_09140, partial [Polyangiaceae bacterium]|nr:hypothetical protein [Polyangiaceae bacterium]